MDKKKDGAIARRGGADDIAAFVEAAKKVPAPAASGRGRLIFALDADHAAKSVTKNLAGQSRRSRPWAPPPALSAPSAAVLFPMCFPSADLGSSVIILIR